MTGNKELIAATERELQNWPGTTMTEEQGGKHSRVLLHFKGESRIVVTSSTPGDFRAVPNHLSVVRKELRALGAEKARVVVGQPKPRPAPKPATHKPFKTMESPMGRPDKIDEIFKGIETLRYSEMLDLAGRLSEVAGAVNLRRGDPRSWAMMLQAAVDDHKTAPVGGGDE